MSAVMVHPAAERSIWSGLVRSFRRDMRAGDQAKRARIRRNRSQSSANFEKGMTFYLWASQCGAMPDVHDVRARFRVSRATAYRWLEVYRRLSDGAPL